jgi:hypothetical protein
MPDKADPTIGQSSAAKAQKGAESLQADAFPQSASGSAGRGSSPNAGGAASSSGATIDKAKETLSNVASQAGDKVASRLDTQKDKAADGLGSVAQALRQTGKQLRDEDQSSVIHGYVSSAADQVDRLSGYLRSTNTREIVNGVEQFARQQPALFVGAAFMLGMLGARFLKSSGSGQPSSVKTTPTPRSEGFTARSGNGEAQTSRQQGMTADDYSPPPATPPARGRGNY